MIKECLHSTLAWSSLIIQINSNCDYYNDTLNWCQFASRIQRSTLFNAKNRKSNGMITSQSTKNGKN